MTDENEPMGVTVLNADAWAARPEQLAAILTSAPVGGVVPDPTGAPADADRLATVVCAAEWATAPAALADALRSGGSSAVERPGDHASGAVTSGPERLTLTVEEAAALIGISRAFAYEAVRRGEIPSIRIGRRVLVPRAALDRLLAGENPGGT